MDQPLYRLHQLTIEHGERRTLDIPELELPRAGVTALVGPNGAGKTTLLRVLAFLLPPTAGEVTFNEAPVSYHERHLSALRRHVTLVAQSPFVFHRSVRANVAYGLRARGAVAAPRVEAALATVGLADFADRPAWKLSGGEAQRVAIARALAIEPSVYLFDEPTASIDREHVEIIERVIAELGAAGRSVILTTHNLDQAYRLSDRVLSLVGGRISAAPLVNVLRGTTTRSGDESYFESAGLRIEIADGSTPHVIAIAPEDILLSCEALHSSARNSLAGHIVRVARNDPGVLVTVDCGQPLVARITRHSYTELGLNIGSPVYVSFKSSAIHVLGG